MPKDSVNKLEHETIEMASEQQSTNWKKFKTKNPKIARTIKVSVASDLDNATSCCFGESCDISNNWYGCISFISKIKFDDFIFGGFIQS